VIGINNQQREIPPPPPPPPPQPTKNNSQKPKPPGSLNNGQRTIRENKNENPKSKTEVCLKSIDIFNSLFLY
jgi:hypothetical protein